jgi:hypothetical protein
LERAYVDREVGQDKMMLHFPNYKRIEYTPLEQYEVVKMVLGYGYEEIDLHLEVFRMESDSEFEERLRKLDESEKET